MMAVRLPPEIEKRLERLARKTGRSKTFYVRQAILQHLEAGNTVRETTGSFARFRTSGSQS